MSTDRGVVVIIGQGYVGLPLAVAAATAGWRVIGLDHSNDVVAALNAGRSHVNDVPDEQLAPLVASDAYRASADASVVAAADVIVICVPTPYHNDAPDLSHVQDAGTEVGRHLTPGTLVILESTTYPGTTEELLQPILEQGSGLRAGTDFHLVFSPERIDPGSATHGLHNTPKIVGGLTPEGTALATEFYGSFVDTVVPVSGPKAAEMAKLLENTFRHINIALVNELAILCQGMDIDVWEVIDAAASKPFGFMPFYPGPGVGGHCIPVDPLYLSWKVKQFGGSAKFIELARDVNAAMPAYCVARVQDLLNTRKRALSGATVLVLGVAYKSDVSDMRESPAITFIRGLAAKGVSVVYHDPFVPSVEIDDVWLTSQPLTSELVQDADCVVVLTAHRDVDYAWLGRSAQLLFDTRNVVPAGPNVHRL